MNYNNKSFGDFGSTGVFYMPPRTRTSTYTPVLIQQQIIDDARAKLNAIRNSTVTIDTSFPSPTPPPPSPKIVLPYVPALVVGRPVNPPPPIEPIAHIAVEPQPTTFNPQPQPIKFDVGSQVVNYAAGYVSEFDRGEYEDIILENGQPLTDKKVAELTMPEVNPMLLIGAALAVLFSFLS